jgi:hypothetical protein
MAIFPVFFNWVTEKKPMATAVKNSEHPVNTMILALIVIDSLHKLSHIRFIPEPGMGRGTATRRGNDCMGNTRPYNTRKYSIDQNRKTFSADLK